MGAGVSLLAGIALSGCAGVEDLADPAAYVAIHPFPVRQSTPGVRQHDVHGVDVAKYQGEIDWAQVKASGQAFAFIKATEGADRLDDRFAQNWQAASQAGLARGAYHFSYWCSPMSAQAEWFKRNVPVDPTALPPVLDLEWNSKSPTCPRSVPRDIAIASIRSFISAIEQHYRKRPILYTDINFHRDVLSDGVFAEYPVWVRSVKDLPQMRYPGRQWSFWQYSDKSAVPGITGLVDRNAFAGSRAQWDRLVADGFVQAKREVTATGP